MNDIDLLQELERAQTAFEQQSVVKEAEAILRRASTDERAIADRIYHRTQQEQQLHGWIDQLDGQRIFDLSSIEHICTKYRLRFLDSQLFKGDIPAEAVREVRRIEAVTGACFEHFKIVAPAERFHLKDSTKDPILLAELPNGRYLYIFQWGDDMAWYQQLLKYPFRHIGTLAASSSLIGFLIAFLVPSQFEAMQAEFFYRFFMFSMSTCLVMTLAIITAIMYSKDFSENVWNSKFNR